MEAYCLKCKQKREIRDISAGFHDNGSPYIKGVCPVCSTKIHRFGMTDLHVGLEKPAKAEKQVKNKKEKQNQQQRKGNLVIVESPAKARTVSNYLGKEYLVKASVGHVRDLLRSQLSVDVDNGFEPKYRVPNEKRTIVKELKSAAKSANHVFLATDPDREGEAIAWHLIEVAELEKERVKRVVFHEITKPAIEEAFSQPRSINFDLVDAQQARRILDRLVGYNLTPLLWRKVRGRLSAGRVQSVTLRIIIEREREIEAFIPEEYWSIDAEFGLENKTAKFIARLVKIDQQDLNLPKQDYVDDIIADLEKAIYHVKKIKRGTRTRKAFPPFTTSTLQQQASRQLGFTAKRTMMVAQQLYEGIMIGGEGEMGLITYMRTDSTQVSDIAINQARDYIQSVHGESFIPKEPVRHRTKSAQAQEAHEAIRPTSVYRTPENIKDYLTKEQFKLYQLIWKRFVASQMSSASYETLSIDVEGKKDHHIYLFRASGSKLIFPGFLVLYEEAREDDSSQENGELDLPQGLKENDNLLLFRLIPEQHFTQPPPHFSEASLVQTLEEYGIGRPSTYASIISTIQARGYIERDGKKLIPTETGFLVNDLLVQYFPDVLGIDFTAKMEKNLDEIAEGGKKWQDTVSRFYENFEGKVKIAQEEIPENLLEPETIDKKCPVCNQDLVIKWGRFGRFISCSTYPQCKYTEQYLNKVGVNCPKDGGDLVERKTRKGRIFFGCANYPDCDFTSWKRPIKEKCPNCSGIMVIKNKNEVQCLECSETFTNKTIEFDKTA